jgi:WD40 repeat protein
MLSLTYSPCGRFLYSAGWQHVSRWDVNSGEEARVDQDGCGGYCQCLTVSADGKRIAWLAQVTMGWQLRLGDADGLSQTGDHRFPDRMQVGGLPRHGHLAGDRIVTHTEPLIVDPDGSWVAYRQGKKVRVGRPSLTLHAPGVLVRVQDATLLDGFDISDSATTFGFSSSQLIWTAMPRLLRVRDTQTGQVVSSAKAEVVPRALTPDGRTGVATRQREVILLDVPSGLVRERFNWDVGTVEAVAIAPDGLTAAVVGWSGGIAIFDLAG